MMTAKAVRVLSYPLVFKNGMKCVLLCTLEEVSVGPFRDQKINGMPGFLGTLDQSVRIVILPV